MKKSMTPLASIVIAALSWIIRIGLIAVMLAVVVSLFVILQHYAHAHATSFPQMYEGRMGG